MSAKRLNLCPRCREAEPDTENHPTGIRLCERCSHEIANTLIDERAGQVIDDPRARRRAERYEEHRLTEIGDDH